MRETITCLWNKCTWFVMNSNIISGVSLCELLSSDTQMSFHWMKGMINSLTQSHEKDKHWITLPSLLFLILMNPTTEWLSQLLSFSSFLHTLSFSSSLSSWSFGFDHFSVILSGKWHWETTNTLKITSFTQCHSFLFWMRNLWVLIRIVNMTLFFVLNQQWNTEFSFRSCVCVCVLK